MSVSLLNNTTVYQCLESYEEGGTAFISIMNKNYPLFFGRVGGSDYIEVCRYFYNKALINSPTFGSSASHSVKMSNGYFDFYDNHSNFQKYLDDMILFYKSMDSATYACAYLVSQFNTGDFTQMDSKFLGEILKDKTVINYAFIEFVKPFLASLPFWASDKKILIISPFSKSIEHQYKNKDNLYLNYKFPNFELKTYNTKITYNAPEDTKESLGVTTNNWHEECERLANEISKIDFDIALLSCASYGMFLGNFIKCNMGRKAMYLGGILNVIFNIYGGRFKNYYNFVGSNLIAQIDPFENADILNIKGGRTVGWSESLNAYFGKREEQ